MSDYPQQHWFCHNCGHQNQLNFKHCTECGTALPSQQAYTPSQNLPPTQQKKSGATKIIGFGCLGLMAFCVVMVIIASLAVKPDKTSRNGNSLDISPITSASPYVSPTPLWNDLTVVKSSWQEGGFGAISIWKVTFKNNSDQAIGNIKYRTAYYSETGTVVDKGGVDSILDKKLVQKVIPPRSTRTLEINDGFTHSQAHRAAFEVVGCEFVSDKR